MWVRQLWSERVQSLLLLLLPLHSLLPQPRHQQDVNREYHNM